MKNEVSPAEQLQLKTMGVHVAIDEFGTGYSSLCFLKRYPLDALKIDPSFIKDITTESTSEAIATAVIAMAQSLSLTVVAEGVETDQQLAFLRNQGCDELQGHLFSPPVSPNVVTKFLPKRDWKS